jgi:alcohol dehydrogenase class IV
MRFVFRTAGEITFGAGAAMHAPAAAARFGNRVMLVVGGRSLERSGMLERLEHEILRAGMSATRWAVTTEPEVAAIDEGTRLCRDARVDVVLAIGGGSVLDAAKAIAALAVNDGHAVDYLEDLGSKRPRTIERTPLPVVAVPTTAGSGAEVTRNSVLRVPEARVKRSLRSVLLIPRAAIVDPELSSTAPRSVAASSGLDALTHLVEAYVSRGAQPTTDRLAVEGIRLAASALWLLAEEKATPESNAAMALASLWGGMALANAGLGAVHGLVAPLGGRYSIPHGAGCGCLLAATLRTNADALRARSPTSTTLERYDTVARALVRDGERTIEHAADAIDALRRALGIGTLARYGVAAGELAEVVARARGGSMRSNPIDLTDAELERILADSLNERS